MFSKDSFLDAVKSMERDERRQPAGQTVTATAKAFLLRLPEPMHRALSLRAEQHGTSMNELVLRALEDYLSD